MKVRWYFTGGTSQHKPNHNDTHIHNDTTMTRNIVVSQYMSRQGNFYIHTYMPFEYTQYFLKYMSPDTFSQVGGGANTMTGTVSQRPTVHIPPPDTQEIRRYIFYGASNTYDTHILQL